MDRDNPDAHDLSDFNLVELPNLENSPTPLSFLHHFPDIRVPFEGKTHVVDLLASTDMVGEQKGETGPFYASGRRPRVLVTQQLARLSRGAQEYPDSDNQALLTLFDNLATQGQKYVVIATHGSTHRGDFTLEYVLQDQLHFQGIGSFLKEFAAGSQGKNWSGALLTACNEDGFPIPQENLVMPTAIYNTTNSGVNPSTVKLYTPASYSR